jgi:hypothetical protein
MKIYFVLFIVALQINIVSAIEFNDPSLIKLLGNSVLTENKLRLTDANGGQLGVCWFKEKQNVRESFVINIDFQISNCGGLSGGADGFAFIIQNNDSNSMGNSAEGIGYDAIPNSIAIEFDTYLNSNRGDPDNNHIAVNTNGKLPNSPSHKFSLALAPLNPKTLNLKDGLIHNLQIKYFSNLLSVFIDDTNNPFIEVSINIDSILKLDNGKAWMGFSASTGGGYERHDIISYSHSNPNLNLIKLEAKDTVAIANTKNFKLPLLIIKEYENRNNILSFTTNLVYDASAFLPYNNTINQFIDKDTIIKKNRVLTLKFENIDFKNNDTLFYNISGDVLIPDSNITNLEFTNIVCKDTNIIFAKKNGSLEINSSASALLQSADISGYPGDVIEVPIILKNQMNLQTSGVTSLKTDLTYNSTLLAPMDYTFQKMDDTKSKITIDSLPVNKAVGDTLAKIPFKVGLGNADNCDLILSNAKAIGGTLDISLSNGKFKLLGVCHEGGKRLINPNGNAIDLQISPNPSDGNIIAAFNLIEDNNTALRIYDNTGNVVYEKNIEKYTGKMEMNIDTSTLGNGLYFVSLQTPTYRIVKPLMIVK